ncbi:BHMG1 protein, partial [Ciccaba nigrolineata]|nr:BHMG1 protein [Ciccaba nigrolineata]
TGPYWEALDWDGGVPLTPCPGREGLLGLSPSLLASPPPLGPPDEVCHRPPPALFADVYLSPQVGTVSPPAPAVAPQEAAADSSPVSRRVAVGMGGTPRTRGQGAPPRPKKKCVNGFIMFCSLNRKHYMSAHPGLASTAATRELAQLWHSLSPDERRPYCLWARRFSRLHNRVTRPDGDGDGDTNPP